MILVTGGAGYIGSHCVLALLEKGEDVVIFDNLSIGHIETIDTLKEYGNLEFQKGDLKNFDDINSIFKKFKIDKVVHFAAFSQVGESVINPQKYYMNNVCGTLNLLRAMVENDIEKIMDDYNKAYGLKSVRLRYFNVAGADSKSRIGEWHEPETHLIPNILKSTFTDSKTFEMYGTDYDTKDGTCVRDYIDVEDLARAHILALKYLENGGETDFFNLGTNDGNTVKEVFDICEKVTGKNIPVNIKPRRPGDPASLVADNTKAKSKLGWDPVKTIEDSIGSAYNWEKNLTELK